MAGKVVSIEIGNSLTKVALVDFKAKTTKVYKAFVFDTPEGTIDDGYIKNTEAFCETLASKMAAEGISEKRVVFAISSSKIANREVTLPLVSKDKIMSMIRANASDYFPVDIKNYHLSYSMLEKIVTKEEKSMKLLLLAVPLDLVETYFDLAKVMNMSLQGIDYAGNSIVQVTKNLKKTETNVCIHINEKNTIISILENGVLALQRTVAYGSDSAVDAMLNIDKYRYDDTCTREKIQDILLNTQMINTVMPENDEAAYNDPDLTEDEKERSAVTSSLRYLIGNITRVLDYYMTKTAGARVDIIYLSGIGAEFKGLRELFSFEIGSQVKTFRNIENVIYEPTDVMTSMSVMLVAIGASKDPMNLMPSEFAQKAVKKVSLVGPTAILIGGIAIAVALVAYGMIAKGWEESTKADLQKDYEEMQQYVDIKNNYDATVKGRNAVINMYVQTENQNENLVAFIEELEEKMPKDFEAMSVTVNETGMSMSVTVAEYIQAAEVIQQLRTFESLNPATISAPAFIMNEKETDSEVETDEEGNEIVKETEKETKKEVETETDEDGETIEVLETFDHYISFNITASYMPVKGYTEIPTEAPLETVAPPTTAAEE